MMAQSHTPSPKKTAQQSPAQARTPSSVTVQTQGMQTDLEELPDSAFLDEFAPSELSPLQDETGEVDPALFEQRPVLEAHAQPLQHIDKRLHREFGAAAIACAIEPHHQAVADQLVVANTDDIGHITDLVGRKR